MNFELRKNIPGILSIAVILLIASSFNLKKFDPVGKWKAASEKGNVNYMEFTRDGRIRFRDEKDSILVSDIALRYKFDFDKNPVQCDFIIYSLYGDKIGLMEGIVEVKSKDNFILKISKNQRPKSFTDKEGEKTEYTRMK
ncbi:MAG: hypothetical protein K2X86_15985 [Cytophagaceae bacterium]|nr:hypothetical protein [Cytophagaceae bacterium]